MNKSRAVKEPTGKTQFAMFENATDSFVDIVFETTVCGALSNFWRSSDHQSEVPSRAKVCQLPSEKI